MSTADKLVPKRGISYQCSIHDDRGRPACGFVYTQGLWFMWPCPVHALVLLAEGVRYIHDPKEKIKAARRAYCVHDLLDRCSDCFKPEHLAAVKRRVLEAEADMQEYLKAHPDECEPKP